MRALKWILISVVTVLMLVFAALQFLFNPNDYKPLIVEQVKQQTGRDLVLNGDISWKFLPTLALGIEDVQLLNPAHFPEQPMIAINSARVSVQVWPLLTGEIKLGELGINGLKVNLLTLEDGSNNLDDLVKAEQKDIGVQEQPQPGPDGGSMSMTLELDGLSIADVLVTVKDLNAGSEQQLNLEYITLGKFALGQQTPLTFKLLFEQGEALQLALEGAADLQIDPSMNTFQATNLSLDTTINGSSVPKTPLSIKTLGRAEYDLQASGVVLELSTLQIADINGSLSFEAKLAPQLNAEFAAEFDKIDVDSWLPASPAEATSAAQSSNAEQSSGEVDLSILHEIALLGDIEVGKLIASGVTLQTVQAHIEVGDGRATLDPLEAGLYSGRLVSSATLTDTTPKPTSELALQLRGVDVNPLLVALADNDMLEGAADLQLSLKAIGLTPEDMKTSGDGKGSFAFKDGALKGINVAHTIRKGYATIKGESADVPDEPKQTDFTSLTGSFSLGKGIIANPDLDMRSPLLRISGEGNANILKESLDYGLTTAFVGSLKGQQGKSAEELTSLRIPLRIKGSFTQPEYELDVDKLLEGEAKQKLDEEKDKLLDKAKEKLGKFFGG